MVVFDKRHEEDIIINLYYENLLSFILLLVGMLKYVQQESFFNIKNNILK